MRDTERSLSLHPSDSLLISLIQMAAGAGRHASGAWERAPSLLPCRSHLLLSLFALLSTALPRQHIHQTLRHRLKHLHPDFRTLSHKDSTYCCMFSACCILLFTYWRPDSSRTCAVEMCAIPRLSCQTTPSLSPVLHTVLTLLPNPQEDKCV